MRRALKRYSDKTALESEGRSWTYSELDEAIESLAKTLAAKGIGPGKFVALLLRNSAAFVIGHLAISRCGAARVPLNDMLSKSDITFMLDDSEASLLIVDGSLEDRIDQKFDTIIDRIVVPEGCSNKPKKWIHRDIDTDQKTDGNCSTFSPDLPALILYTGGTTGKPKGVVHTHASMGANLVSHTMHCDVLSDERLLLSTPLPHSAHLILEAAMLCGAHVALEQKFNPKAILEAINEGRITFLFLVPTMIYRLLDHDDLPKTDFSKLRTVLYGGAPIGRARLEQGIASFGPVFLQLYGLTEVPNFICQLSKTDHLEGKNRTSCGRPTIFCDVRIMGPEGVQHEGEPGEVEVKGPYVLKNYHKNPERSSEAFNDGWFRTGDVGRMSPSGYLHLVDRAKDMIVTGGMNVYSTEVEAVLEMDEAVTQAVVIGIPHDEWGEAVHAFVVLDKNASFEGDLLLKHSKKHLARYKVPKKVEAISSIPLTAYGKPDKVKLREIFWADRSRSIG
jgi:fatty-acyl-CoA synthase/long-chain acyl-CoA synthetase